MRPPSESAISEAALDAALDDALVRFDLLASGAVGDDPGHPADLLDRHVMAVLTGLDGIAFGKRSGTRKAECQCESGKATREPDSAQDRTANAGTLGRPGEEFDLELVREVDPRARPARIQEPLQLLISVLFHGLRYAQGALGLTSVVRSTVGCAFQ